MKRAFATIICVLFLADIAEGASLKDLTRIKDFKVLSSSEEIRVVVKTAREVSSIPVLKTINDRLLQMEIDGSYTELGKRSFAVDDPLLERVEIYQFNTETVRLRLHLLSPYEEGAGEVVRDNEGFVISLKRKGIVTKKSAGSGHKIEDAFPAIFGAKQAFAGVTENIPNRAEEQRTSNPVGRVLASLALVVGLFLVGSYLFREKFFKKGITGKGNLIRVLDRGYIDVKKGITIVDVAGEVLVLGTSGEGITMLTKLENEEALRRIEPLYKSLERRTFGDAVKLASGKSGQEPSETLIDRIRRLKPIG